MPRDRETRLFRVIDRLVPVMAVVAIIALVISAIDQRPPEMSWLEGLNSLWRDLIPEFIAVLAAIPVAYLLLRAVERLRKEYETEQLAEQLTGKLMPILRTALSETLPTGISYYENIDQVPWDDLIRRSTRVDICVHFWPNWIGRHADAFKALFASSGMVRLVLPNNGNRGMLREIKHRLPDYSEQEIGDAIEKTHNGLATILKASAAPQAGLETYFVDYMLWYCALRFDRDTLALSFYEHKRLMRVASPTILVDLSVFSDTAGWFDKEMTHFMEGPARHESIQKARSPRSEDVPAMTS